MTFVKNQEALRQVNQARRRVNVALGLARKTLVSDIAEAKKNLLAMHAKEMTLRKKHVKLGSRLMATAKAGVELTPPFWKRVDEYDAMTVDLHKIVQNQQALEELIAGAEMGEPYE